MSIGQQWDFAVAWQASPQLLVYGTYLRLFTGQFWADTQATPTVPMNALSLLTQFYF
jgi:hypothetical protein